MNNNHLILCYNYDIDSAIKPIQGDECEVSGAEKRPSLQPASNADVSPQCAQSNRIALKAKFSLSFISLTIWIDISYSSFIRWKRRVLSNEDPIKKPGPKKTTALDLAAVKKDICQLKHYQKKSMGTGQLIKKYRHSVSRRHLAFWINKVRQHANNKTEYRITWHHPDLVWAIDGREIKLAQSGTKVYLQNLQDLCSIYKFGPLTTLCQADGENVSAYFSERFDRYGVPLFF